MAHIPGAWLTSLGPGVLVGTFLCHLSTPLEPFIPLIKQTNLDHVGGAGGT